MAEIEYWYCTKHHRVEWEQLCPAIDRLGPYPSRVEAERALDRFAARNEKWENDPRWNDDVDEEAGGAEGGDLEGGGGKG